MAFPGPGRMGGRALLGRHVHLGGGEIQCNRVPGRPDNGGDGLELRCLRVPQRDHVRRDLPLDGKQRNRVYRAVHHDGYDGLVLSRCGRRQYERHGLGRPVLYNTDNGGGTIFIYTTTGTLVGSYTTAAIYPYDISWDYLGPTYMWCADPVTGSYTGAPDIIWQLDAAGSAVSSFAAPGTQSAAGDSAYPAGITVVPPYLYISDAYLDTIYVVDPGVPVPVELASFAGRQEGASVVLTWTTRTEINNLGFKVYRSTLADLGFRKLTEELIPGAGTTSEPQSYWYVDPRVPPGTYYYQLEDISLSGETRRHGPVVVSVAATGLVASVENPATDGALIRFTLPRAGRYEVAVYDARGSLVRTVASGNGASGAHSVQWNGTDQTGETAAQGFYLARVQTDDAELSVRFILTR